MVIKKPKALRARKEEDKTERRDRLLAAARELLGNGSYDAIKMLDVAGRAGFAKGTAFFYFPTKEALFLQLLEVELFDWLSVLDHKLSEGGLYTPERVARIFASTLTERPVLTSLLSLLGVVLEENVSLERIVAFKSALLERLAVSGPKLERRLPNLPEGSGAKTLLHVYALVVGLHHLTEPSAVVREALQAPHLAPLVLDFSAELTPLLIALFHGLSVSR